MGQKRPAAAVVAIRGIVARHLSGGCLSLKIEAEKVNLLRADRRPKETAREIGFGFTSGDCLRQKDALPAIVCMVTVLARTQLLQDVTQYVPEVIGAEFQCTDGIHKRFNRITREHVLALLCHGEND